MDEVVLRRRRLTRAPARSLLVLAACLGVAGAAALVAVRFSGWAAAAFVALFVIVVAADALFPRKTLIADHDGLRVGSGRRRAAFGWDEVARVIVSARTDRYGAVGVVARDGRDAARRDKPFALAASATFAVPSPAESAQRIRAVAPVPVSLAGDEGRTSHRVLAVRGAPVLRQVAPFFFLFPLGEIVPVRVFDDHPGTAYPLAVVALGITLALSEFAAPRTVFAADDLGLWFDGEFLLWGDIRAIRLRARRGGTELLIRPAPGAPAAFVEPEIRRFLPSCLMAPAALRSVAPSHVAIDA